MRFILPFVVMLVIFPAGAAEVLPGYAIVVDDQILSGDMGCMRICFTRADCEEGIACSESAVGPICASAEQASGLLACDQNGMTCRQGSVCTRLTSGLDQLEGFIAHKQARGLAVHLIPSGQILTGSELDRRARALRVRQWLQSNKDELNLVYLLIISHPMDGDIPMMGVHPRHNATEPWATDIEVQSDTFYSVLQGDWDADDDDVYGEWGTPGADPSGDYGAQGIHFNYDLAVGRIPYYHSTTAVDAVLAKTIRYQLEPESRSAYRQHALLAAEGENRYFFGEQLRTEIFTPNEITHTRVYDAECYDEQQGDAACSHPLSEAPEYSVCSVANVADAWTQHTPGLVAWLTHGSGAGAAAVMSSGTVQTLPTEHQAMTFQASCLNSSPGANNNLSSELLKGPVVASVGATSISHGPGGPVPLLDTAGNAGMAYAYFARLISARMPVGQALADLRQDIEPSQWWFGANYLTFVLYGDPEVSLFDHGPEASILIDGSTEINEGEQAQLSISATTYDGESLAVELSGLSEWMAFAGGILTMAPGYEAAGEYTIEVTASGSVVLVESLVITVRDVNRAPVLGCPARLVSEDCAFVSVSDPDGDEVTVSLNGTELGVPDGQGVSVCRSQSSAYELSATDGQATSICRIEFSTSPRGNNPAQGCSCSGLTPGWLLFGVGLFARQRRRRQ